MAVFSVMHPYYVFITSFRVALCFVLLLDALGLNLKLLRRVSLMLPVIVIAGFKFDPAKLESVTEAIALCAPGSEMPPSEQLNLIAGVEIGLVVLVTLGLGPKVVHSFAAIHMGVVPILLLRGVSSVSPYYVFVLSLHVGVAVALVAEAWAKPKELTSAQKRTAARKAKKK